MALPRDGPMCFQPAWPCLGLGAVALGALVRWKRVAPFAFPCGPCPSAFRLLWLLLTCLPIHSFLQNGKMPLHCDIDLLAPSAELEKRKHKLKRLVQSPNSYFMDVKW